MNKMCATCPHRIEHEECIEIVLFPDHKIHPCHSNMEQGCYGHKLQKQKIANNIVQVEDFPLIRTYRDTIERDVKIWRELI